MIGVTQNKNLTQATEMWITASTMWCGIINVPAVRVKWRR